MIKKIEYVADGKTKEFLFSFPFFQASDVHVMRMAANADEYEILGTNQYGIILSPDYDNTPDSEIPDIPYTGGRIVFSNAPGNGTKICIFRRISLGRIIDYQDTAPISPRDLNRDFNQLAMYIADAEELYKDTTEQIKKFENILISLNGLKTEE